MIGRTALERLRGYRRPGRVASHRHESNHVSPALICVSDPRQTTQRRQVLGNALACRRSFSRTLHSPPERALSGGVHASLRREVFPAFGRRRIFFNEVAVNRALISLRRNDPWQDATQDCAESLGFAASIIGVRHASEHGASDGPNPRIISPKPETRYARCG